ncbi:MAG: substrate-binding domain-containing protein [Anaerolineae bacterium]|nr:substrate-binding domain-containing protein [Anaerolineae bacterium]
MKKSLVVSLITVMLLAAVVVPGAQASQAYTPVVGMSLPTVDDPFFIGMGNGAATSSEELAVDVMVKVADGTVEAEVANVQALLDEGIAALVISPVDPTDLSAVALANEAGVPVFLVDLDGSITGAEVVSTLTLDYEQGGVAAGTVLCEAVEGAGTVIALVDETTDHALALRQGFEDYMAENCADVSVEVLEVGALTEDEAQASYIEFLGAHDVTGVYADNGPMTMMAVNAAFLAGQRGLVVVGTDATDDAMAALEQGLLQAVITPVGWWFGERVMTASDALLADEDVPDTIMVHLGVMDEGVISAFRGGDEDDSIFKDMEGGAEFSGDARTGSFVGGDGTTAFRGGGEGDSNFSGGGEDDSNFSGGGEDDSNFSGGGEDDSNFSGGGEDDSNFSGGGEDDSNFSGGGEDDSNFSGGDNNNSN